VRCVVTVLGEEPNNHSQRSAAKSAADDHSRSFPLKKESDGSGNRGVDKKTHRSVAGRCVDKVKPFREHPETISGSKYPNLPPLPLNLDLFR
jgi:hypothetical protein